MSCSGAVGSPSSRGEVRQVVITGVDSSSSSSVSSSCWSSRLVGDRREEEVALLGTLHTHRDEVFYYITVYLIIIINLAT